MTDIKKNYGISANTVNADAIAIGDNAHAEVNKSSLSMSEIKLVVDALQEATANQELGDLRARIEELSALVKGKGATHEEAGSLLDGVVETIKKTGVVLDKSGVMVTSAIKLLGLIGLL